MKVGRVFPNSKSRHCADWLLKWIYKNINNWLFFFTFKLIEQSYLAGVSHPWRSAAEVSAEDDVNDDSLVESEAMTLDDVTVRTRQKTQYKVYCRNTSELLGVWTKAHTKRFLNSSLPTVVWVYSDNPMENVINLLFGCSFPSVLKVF